MSDNNNSKVFVGRLPDGCTEKDLEDLFGTYGTVNQTDLIGKYGFVHMTKREEAEEAIKKLNNYNFMGSQLTVQISTSKMNGNSAKTKGFAIKRGMNRRNTGPYNRNNSYQSPRPFVNDRFEGPPPVPPNNFMPYYDDMNGYYREPYYPEPEPYYPPNNQRGVSPYEAPPPPYGRRGPPPLATDYPARAPAPIQPDFYNRGDGPYNRVPAYGQNRAAEAPPRAMGGQPFSAQPMRNGYGNTGFSNRAPNGGPGLANRPAAASLPPPNGRWQPY